ncbi:MFS-type transporter clz9-like [Homalodisca vitripennis]|uniref:MFS-type transporter clz9-like n=1 Tax=Homalodisca vitripennis TaxID=197043 RepID=UPI001EEC8F52|nr:MFS-type transporter clz9-like [Homalodisca vitripennis]
MARASGFIKERTDIFYDTLTQIVDENKLQASDIFNVDETALSTVQRPRKVLAQKGKHEVGSMTSAERGTLTTGIFCMSAAGVFVPPMLVFKGLRFKPEWKIGAPPGTTFDMTENGWSNAEVFLNWLKTFVSFIKPSKDKQCLIILDGHTSHTKNLEAIEYARDHGVILLSLPSHTSHRLQPLHVSFFGPLKTYFHKACEVYFRTHLTKITVSHISHLLNESYPKSAVVATAINGFRATGIWPINKDLFEDHDFAVHTNMPVVIRNDAVTRDQPNDDIRPSTSQIMKNGSDRPFMPETPCSSASVGTSRAKKIY